MRALAVILLSVAFTGCTIGGSEKHNAALTVVSGDPEAVQTTIVGASPRQEQVLREILAGVGATSIRRITVKRAGKEFRPHPRNAVGVAFQGRGGFESYYWRSWIVGQAFAHRSQHEDLPSVVYVATEGEWSRVSPRRSRPAPPLTADEREQLADSVSEEAVHAGAELRSLQVFRPYGTAIAIVFEVPDPARFLAERYERLQARIWRLVERFPAGFMVSVHDPEGRMARSGFNISGSLGASTAARKYEGCTRLGLSTPLGYRPPPCPIEPR